MSGDLGFLNGGGEMGKRTREFDWSTSPLGLPKSWPGPLQYAVSNMLQTAFPMLVLWGKEFICFYNDAFRPSLGKDGHPALGKEAKHIWSDGWKFISAQLNKVLDTGEAVTFEDQPVAIHRDGVTTDIFWTFCYSPVLDNYGKPCGVLVTCMETTTRQNRVYETVISATPDLVYVFDLKYRFSYANKALLNMWGKTKETAIGRGLRENGYEEWHAAMHEREIDHVVATGESVRGEVAFPHAVLGRRVYDYILVPVFDDAGKVEAVAGTTRDISDIKQAESRIRDSEEQFRNLVIQAPVAIAVFRGEQLTCEIANEAYLKIVGKKDTEFVNIPLFDSLPEVRPSIEGIVRNVMQTGENFYATEFEVVINRYGSAETCFFNFTYSALRGNNGNIDGFFVVANEVTAQVIARRKVEESEARFRMMAEISPFYIAVGDESGNATYFNNAWVELTGRPMKDLLEFGWVDFIHPADKERYVNLYLDALKIKAPFTGEFRVRNPKGEYRWLLANGAPRFDAGKVFKGYVSACADITNQKQIESELRNKERALANAIELAELGTWALDGKTGQLSLSKTYTDMYGLKALYPSLQDAVDAVIEVNREELVGKMTEAMRPGSSGRFEGEYRIINQTTGKTQIIHALGQAYFDNAGNFSRMEGTTQDVTVQRELQLALENEVQVRTEELQAANEELGTTIEELSESSQLLMRSNEELSQFAYVASHDLQEPVRKISVFAEMLEKSAPDLDERSKKYLAKIDDSANRMLTLIRDILTHSQIAQHGASFIAVDLNETLTNTLSEFEVLIEEHKCEVTSDQLPTIEAIEVQMSQLFSNLISNALKFAIPGKPLRLEIRSRKLSDEDILHYPNLSKKKIYYQISFIDNGIGFDQSYASQIFEIFQRLHTKQEYSGTGIGLATCKKIVQNHGGGIEALSKKGEGARFDVILPARQVLMLS